MDYEWNRLRSFKNFPKESPVYAIQLARAGFYYAENGDEVVCFSCGASHSEWCREDSPIRTHRHISPNCPFLNGEDTRNVKISDITLEAQMASPTVPQILNRGISSSGAVYGSENTADPSHGDQKGGTLGEVKEARHPYNASVTNVLKTHTQMPKHPEFAVLAIRVSSFQNWPMYSGITPRSLAEAGLFYVGKQYIICVCAD